MNRTSAASKNNMATAVFELQLAYNDKLLYLPNKVILSILLHCMAKVKSELSKIVIKSLSEKDKRRLRI